jgi:hypothetical protein
MALYRTQPCAYPSAVRSRTALASLVLLTLWSTTAHAYEDQIGLALGAGYTAKPYDQPDISHHGAGVHVDVGVGLSDVWEVRGHVGYAALVEGPVEHRLELGAEAIYLIDVLTVVPYFGAGIGGLMSVDARGARPDLLLDAVVGLDWLVTRQWVLGLDARIGLNVTGLARGPADPTWLTAGLRVQYLFEI